MKHSSLGLLAFLLGFSAGDTSPSPLMNPGTVFASLPCNDGIDLVDCDEDFESFADQNIYDSQTGEENTKDFIDKEINIPCGKCVSMKQYTNHQTLNFKQGLKVVGKLVFPEGTKVTIRTPLIIIQGELSMTATSAVNGKPDIKFIMVDDDDIFTNGSDDLYFKPEEDDTTGTQEAQDANDKNKLACPEVNGCNIGHQAIVVAGGKLNIVGLPPKCLSWTRPLQPPITLAPMSSTDIISNTLAVPLDEHFDNGIGEWYGNLGARSKAVNGADGPYLEISRRQKTWQGPLFALPRKLRQQMAHEEMYFWTARIMIHREDGTTSKCVAGGGIDTSDCPKLEINRMDEDSKIAWFKLSDPFDNIKEDGKWYDVGGSFSYSEAQMSTSNIFALITIHGPESGVVISLDHFFLEHGSNKIDKSALANPCASLVDNGDAQDSDDRTFPMTSWLKKKDSNDILVVKKDISTGNNYFSLSGRTEFYSSLTFDIRPACTVNDSTYHFSMKVRSHSDNVVYPKVVLKIEDRKDDADPTFAIISLCPGTSNSNTDFVTCEGFFSWKHEHTNAYRLRVLVITKGDNSDGDKSDIDYDDISFTSKQGMEVWDPEDVENGNVDTTCWGVNSNVLLTSQSNDFEDDQLAVIAVSDGGMVDFAPLTRGSDLEYPKSKLDSSSFATEVALLDRNIEFEGEGGHILVLPSSPSKTHVIDGVKLSGFGRTGVEDQYPINLYMTGDQSGTFISRNSIVDSQNRCISLSGVTHATVNNNVCYNNVGHGYVLQDGSERFNKFNDNLGARTNDDNSTEVATFYIANPENTFVGNVAAGSANKGFWFNLKDTVDGDDYNHIKPSSSSINEFKDNVSHSNKVGLTTFPGAYAPDEFSTFEASIIYKNREVGMLLGEGSKMIVSKGIVADNLMGIDVALAENVNITGVEINGYTGETADHCTGVGVKALVGVQLGNKKKKSGEAGNTIEKVTFKNLNTESGCDSSSATQLKTELIVTHINATSTTSATDATTGAEYVGDTVFKDVTYDSSVTGSKFSLCDAIENKMTGLTIFDKEGDLNPEGRNPGFIVPLDSDVSKYAACYDMEGDSCTQYCLESTVQPLPATSTNAPQKAPLVNPDHDGDCSQVVVNGNFDEGTAGWGFIGPVTGIELVAGKDGGDALKTKKRDYWYWGMSQKFNMECITRESSYEVSMDVKILDYSNNPVSCEPYNYYFDSEHACPTLAMRLSDRDTLDIATPVGPWVADGWNKVYGIYKATEDIFDEAKLELYVAKAAANNNVVVDNVSVKPVSANTFGIKTCNELIVNGDAEIGDARFWFIKGNGSFGEIKMITPGASGVAGSYAFHHNGNRAKIWNGMWQVLDQNCMDVGSRWKISFRLKLFNSKGNAAICDKTKQYGDSICPMVFIQSNTNGEGTHNLKPLLNESPGQWVIGGWNDYSAVFEMTKEHKDKNETWWFLHNVFPGYTYQIDDISMVPA